MSPMSPPELWHLWPAEARRVFNILLWLVDDYEGIRPKPAERRFAFEDEFTDPRSVVRIDRRTFVYGLKFLRAVGVVRYARKRRFTVGTVELLATLPPEAWLPGDDQVRAITDRGWVERR